MGRRDQKVKKVKTGANQSVSDDDRITNDETIVTQDSVVTSQVTSQSSNDTIDLEDTDEDTSDTTIDEVTDRPANVSVESGYSSDQNCTMEPSSNSDVEYLLSLITNPPRNKSQYGHPFKTRENMAVVPPGITSFEYKHFINYIPVPCAESREWKNLVECRGCARLLPFNTVRTLPFNTVPTLPFNTVPTLPFNAVPTLPFNAVPTLPFNAVPMLRPSSSLVNQPIGPCADLQAILPAPLFFNHCVYSCERYKSLGLIKKCNDCRSLFLDEMLLNQHKDDCYLIAEENANWKGYKTILSYEKREDLESKNAISKHFPQGLISDELIKEGIINHSSLINDSPLIKKAMKDISIVSLPQVDPPDGLSPSVILCPGCHSPFNRDPIKLDNKWYMNLRYLNHCVFKCPKYRDQIFCTKCFCFFLNDDHYSDGSIHGCKSIKSGRESIKSDLKMRITEKGAGSSKSKQISKSNENTKKRKKNSAKNQRNTGSKSYRKLREFPENVSMILDTRSCAQCDIWFISPKELQHHFQKFHPSSLMFHCSLCPKTFKRQDHVKDHLIKVHAIAGKLVYTEYN